MLDALPPIVLAAVAVAAAGLWQWAGPALMVGASRTERYVVGAALFVQVVFILFAAHPQRIYDQLNYHLVVGELVVRDGQPFTGAWDPHAMFTGVVEWGLSWHRSWGGSKLFFHGLAQIAVYFATV